MIVVACDVFNTVVSCEGLDQELIQAYGAHIKQDKWSPLMMGEEWERLPAFHDSKAAIDRLRDNFFVVTCSNGPLKTLSRLMKYNEIWFDAITPLELGQCFKPRDGAYRTLFNAYSVEPKNVVMVTANREFGDLEAAERLGMRGVLIRDHRGECRDLMHLAEMLENEYLT